MRDVANDKSDFEILIFDTEIETKDLKKKQMKQSKT